MDNEQAFTDYYNLLQVNPNCNAELLDKAYRYFAKMYHPDHRETADPEKFNEVVEAYRVLRDPEQRAEYDRVYLARKKEDFFQFPNQSDFEIDDSTAIADAEVHDRILLFLYKRRREQAYDPGVVGYYVQEMLGCSDENFEFHVWYLKSKRLVDITEHGTLAITIEGVDQVISMSRKTTAELRLIAQGARTEE